jgi:hypothetical protein
MLHQVVCAEGVSFKLHSVDGYTFDCRSKSYQTIYLLFLSLVTKS